jgi:hypothetical protein
VKCTRCEMKVLVKMIVFPFLSRFAVRMTPGFRTVRKNTAFPRNSMYC